LPDSYTAVDATTLAEQGADSAARALGCDKDDIDVAWDFDLGLVLEDWGEAVGEVESLMLG
jgi:hypothetical protein